MLLANATVVITGGAGGLGSLICDAFAEEGARIAVVDLAGESLERAALRLQTSGSDAAAFACDVTDETQVMHLFNAIETRFGPVDILFNGAGTLRGIGPIWEVDIEAWRTDVLVSFIGTFLCSRQFLKHAGPKRPGYIVNMFGGGLKPQAYMSGYVGAKAAVLVFTEELAGELADWAVKAFAIRPGPVRTAMNEYVMNSAAGRRWRPDFQTIFDSGQDTDPQRVKDLALRLCSGQADELSGRLFDATRDFDEVIASADRVIREDLQTMRVRDASPCQKDGE